MAAATTVNRIYNFSAGPCTLPLEVLEGVRDSFVDWQGSGMSLIEMSHRSKAVDAVHVEALAAFGELMGVGDNHEVLFVGGGATLQFTMIAMNLLAGGGKASYTNSGAWAKKAIADAKAFGEVEVVFDGKESNYSTLPDPAGVKAAGGSRYLHLTSNETIGGVQWKGFPGVDVPIVADMSSDILSREIDVDKFGLIYAGAQKNIGPAGMAVVVIRKDVLEMCPAEMPNYMNYGKHVGAGSMLNTPPVFQIWVVGEVLKWLKGKGGVAWAAEMAAKRSGIVYGAIEKSGGYYSCPVDAAVRSPMNVVWRLPSEELEAKFIKEATAAGLDGLKGHRSVGGCRASLYNAMPIEGAEALASFMGEFASKNG